jgi:hypothetical protein
MVYLCACVCVCVCVCARALYAVVCHAMPWRVLANVGLTHRVHQLQYSTVRTFTQSLVPDIQSRTDFYKSVWGKNICPISHIPTYSTVLYSTVQTDAHDCRIQKSNINNQKWQPADRLQYSRQCDTFWYYCTVCWQTARRLKKWRKKNHIHAMPCHHIHSTTQIRSDQNNRTTEEQNRTHPTNK